MPLDITKETEKLKTMYKENAQNNYIRALITGESGSGKTWLMRSCRKPLHLDSFDPGGSSVFADMVQSGDAVVDSRYENEDATKPTEFAAWKTEFDFRRQRGYFDHFGTYCLDSSTLWSEAIMNQILKDAGLAGSAPRFTKDYTPQKIEIRNCIRKMLNLPCDVFVTGHLEPQEIIEGEFKYVEYRFMTTGKGTIIIPLLFSELWVMEPKGTADGKSYKILTQSTGKFLARSRLCKNGLLGKYEDPDIKKLLKKAKFSHEDKSKLKGGD